MAFDFTGRRALVAGGSRGIGRSIALAFAQAGAAVSVCARGAAGIARVRAELAAHNRPVHAATCDLGEATAIARYIEEAAAALGGSDVLINNASGFGLTNDEAGWAASVEVDLMATVRASEAALRTSSSPPPRRSSTHPRSRRCGLRPARRPTARSRRQ